MAPTATHDSTRWTTQSPDWDSTLALMTLLAEPEHFPLAERLGPTPEQVAAKKSRRRLADMVQTRDAHGVIRARYFNDAGFDVWGYSRDGRFDPAQVTATTPNPFIH